MVSSSYWRSVRGGFHFRARDEHVDGFINISNVAHVTAVQISPKSHNVPIYYWNSISTAYF